MQIEVYFKLACHRIFRVVLKVAGLTGLRDSGDVLISVHAVEYFFRFAPNGIDRAETTQELSTTRTVLTQLIFDGVVRIFRIGFRILIHVLAFGL